MLFCILTPISLAAGISTSSTLLVLLDYQYDENSSEPKNSPHQLGGPVTNCTGGWLDERNTDKDPITPLSLMTLRHRR